MADFEHPLKRPSFTVASEQGRRCAHAEEDFRRVNGKPAEAREADRTRPSVANDNCFGVLSADPTVAALLQQEWALPALAGAVGLTGAYASVAAAGLSGGVSGYVATGRLHGAFLSAAESEAFLKVGDLLQDAHLAGAEGAATKFVAHGMVGGLFTVAGGGHFGSGFLAAGFGSLADGVQFHTDNAAATYAGNLTVHALAGGIGATLGGGKFANGAATGAFGYLFNYLMHVEDLPLKNDEVRSYFDNTIAENLRNFCNDLLNEGIPVTITSGFRTDEDQAGVQNSPFGHAAVGQSLHEAGFAFDLNWGKLTPEQQRIVIEEAKTFGFAWGGNFSRPDIVHFQADPWGTSATGLSERRAYIPKAQQQYRNLTQSNQ